MVTEGARARVTREKRSGVKRGFTNASFLSVGAAISQAISLVGMIFVTRLLGPEKYGVYNIVGAFVGMFTVFTFSGLNKVVLRDSARNLREMGRILESSIGLRNLFSFLAMLICLVACQFVGYDAQVRIYISVFALNLLLSGIRESLNVIYQASEKMEYIAIFSVLRTILMVCLSITVLLLGQGIMSLILVQLFSMVAMLIVNFWVSRKVVAFRFFSKPRFDRALLSQGVTFSFIQFFNTLSTRVDLFMLSFMATPAEVGIYALAYKIIQRVNLLRNYVSMSFFPVLTKRFDHGRVRWRTFLFKVGTLSLPIIVIATVIAYFAEPIVVILFGSEYIQSVSILRVLIVYVVMNFVIIPFGLALQTTHNEKISLWASIVQGLLNIVCNLVFFRYFGLIGIAYSTLLTFSVKFIITVFAGYWKLNQDGLVA